MEEDPANLSAGHIGRMDRHAGPHTWSPRLPGKARKGPEPGGGQPPARPIARGHHQPVQIEIDQANPEGSGATGLRLADEVPRHDPARPRRPRARPRLHPRQSFSLEAVNRYRPSGSKIMVAGSG